MTWNRRFLSITVLCMGITGISLLRNSFQVGQSSSPLQMIMLTPSFLTAHETPPADAGPRHAAAVSVTVTVHNHDIHALFGGEGCASVVKAFGENVRALATRPSRCSGLRGGAWLGGVPCASVPGGGACPSARCTVLCCVVLCCVVLCCAVLCCGALLPCPGVCVSRGGAAGPISPGGSRPGTPGGNLRAASRRLQGVPGRQPLAALPHQRHLRCGRAVLCMPTMASCCMPPATPPVANHGSCLLSPPAPSCACNRNPRYFQPLGRVCCTGHARPRGVGLDCAARSGGGCVGVAHPGRPCRHFLKGGWRSRVSYSHTRVPGSCTDGWDSVLGGGGGGCPRFPPRHLKLVGLHLVLLHPLPGRLCAQCPVDKRLRPISCWWPDRGVVALPCKRLVSTWKVTGTLPAAFARLCWWRPPPPCSPSRRTLQAPSP
jgi:hypothetical protein